MFNPEDQVAILRRKCIGCGKCRRACPVADDDFDPMDVMLVGEGDVSRCIKCGKCSEACRRTDPMKVVSLLRGD